METTRIVFDSPLCIHLRIEGIEKALKQLEGLILLGNKLNRKVEKLMSAVSDYVTKQKQFNDRQAAAIDQALASVKGLSDDITALSDKISQLQNTPGELTPGDQTLLNEMEAQGDALATKAEAAAEALKQLDAQNPPPAPPNV